MSNFSKKTSDLSKNIRQRDLPIFDSNWLGRLVFKLRNIASVQVGHFLILNLPFDFNFDFHTIIKSIRGI